MEEEKLYECEICNKKYPKKEYLYSKYENKCILHCEKSTYNIDFRKIGFLNNFYDELIEYIINLIGEKRIIELFEDYWNSEYNDENHPYYSIQSNSIVSLLKPYFNNEDYVDGLFDFLFEDRDIVFSHVFFPEHDGRDNFDYMKIISKLKKIHFNYCKFSTTYLELNNIEVFFQDCEFFNRYSISNSKLLTNESNVIYQMCIFNKDIYISKMDNKENIIENTLFSDCQFKKELEAEDINFKKGIFNNTKDNEYDEINKIRFFNCIIGEDFILQGYKIQSLDLSETLFSGKTKIQYCDIEIEADFYNTKFEDLADFSETKFYKVNFEETDFKNIAVFIESKFHCDVDFKYTKFLGTSIFRDMVITGKLNLRDTIFKEDANFLDITSKSRKVYDEEKRDFIHIGELEDIEVSNRETARIIKNFFDSSNNIIEANRFYKLEMKQREKELDFKKSFLEWIIFKIHSISSNHSQDWLIAIFWIISITFLYSYSNFLLNKDKIELVLFPFIISSLIIFINILEVSIYNQIKNIYKITSVGLLYFIYGFITSDFYLINFSNNINPFSIIIDGNDDNKIAKQIDFLTLIYKIVIAYLIYQLIVSVRQNTRRK